MFPHARWDEGGSHEASVSVKVDEEKGDEMVHNGSQVYVYAEVSYVSCFITTLKDPKIVPKVS